MGELTVEEAERWRITQPNRPDPPGSAEPVPGKCGGRLRNRGLKLANIITPRYCTRPAGTGTSHKGYGQCKDHGGTLQNNGKPAMDLVVVKDQRSLAERLGEPPPLDPAPVEAARLVAKMKVWADEIEAKVAELRSLEVTTRDGTSRARAIVEIMERAHDRMFSALAFALKYDLEERKVVLEENQAQAIASAVLAVLLDVRLNLTDPQIQTGREILAIQMDSIAPMLRPSWATADVIDVDEVA